MSSNAEMLTFEGEDEPEGGGDEWMATFADMMTLLLTFFVLLLSFANMDITRFRMALGSVKDALGVRYQHPGDVEAVATSVVELSQRESTDKLNIMDQMQLLHTVKSLIEEAGLKNKMEVEASGRGIIVRVTGKIFFATGSNRLRPKSEPILDAIGKIAKKVPSPVAVEGHTDDRPIRTSKFPSNWELSTARAATAMRYLVEKSGVDAKRMSVSGYAHMRPLVANDSPKNRARNRRVEFVFIRDVKKPKEPRGPPQ